MMQPSVRGRITAPAVDAPVVRSHPASSTPALSIEHLPVDQWAERVRALRQRDGASFIDLFGGPRGPDGSVSLTLLLARPEHHDWLAIRDALQADSTYPSLTQVLPAADWYEREVFETFHLVPLGHPHLQPLGHHAVTTADELLLRSPLQPASVGVVDYPLGPVRSGIVESGHYTLRTVGEEIVDVRLQLAWKHRGIEDLATSVDPSQLPLLAERISGTDAVAHGLACAAALEALGGQRPSARAHELRLIAAELERLHDHVAFQAELCQATGLVVAQAQFEIVRERLLRLAARIVGHRYLFGFVQPGGVSLDLDVAAVEDIIATVGEAKRDVVRLGAMAAGSGSHLDRLRGTGRVTVDQATDLALTGPLARAAGLDVDARRDLPYGAYRELHIPVALATAGDAAARAAIRHEEALASADLILHVAGHLSVAPEQAVGPTVGDGSPGPASVGLGWAEGSRGMEVHWIETGSDGGIARYRVRSASFACWQGFARSIPGGNILTDFPIVEQSFGLSFAGSDR
jgi:formate hydrogenlyase subunit 5